jgi:hypothetical protein
VSTLLLAISMTEPASAQTVGPAASCDEIQGYYFSEPVPATDCAAMLCAKKRLVKPTQMKAIEYLI